MRKITNKQARASKQARVCARTHEGMFQAEKLEGQRHLSPLTKDTATGFRVWPCFGPVFPHYVPIPPFWNVYSVSLYVEKYIICFLK